MQRELWHQLHEHLLRAQHRADKVNCVIWQRTNPISDSLPGMARLPPSWRCLKTGRGWHFACWLTNKDTPCVWLGADGAAPLGEAPGTAAKENPPTGQKTVPEENAWLPTVPGSRDGRKGGPTPTPGRKPMIYLEGRSERFYPPNTKCVGFFFLLLLQWTERCVPSNFLCCTPNPNGMLFGRGAFGR